VSQWITLLLFIQEVPGSNLGLDSLMVFGVIRMILLCGLKGAMRLGRSKDMSVHVSTCTSYDFNALTLVM
jgi:hypothetical protein